MSEDLRDKITAAIDRAEHDAMRRLNGVPMIGCVGLHAEPLAVLRRCTADRRVLERHQPDEEGVRSSWWCRGDHERDYVWPCDEIRDLADRWGVDA